MRKAAAMFLAAGLAPLAACSDEPEVSVRNASVGEVAQEMRKAGSDAFIRPGKWESRVTIAEFSLPGAPPEMAAAMRGAHDSNRVTTTCLSDEDAKRPKEDFFAGADKSCRYHHFDMSDGKIDAMLNCAAGGVEQVMTIKGSYAPDRYSSDMEMKVSGAGGGAAAAKGMTIKMRVDARHVGRCDSKPA